MTTIRAHVRNGQIVPDEPIDLPEGAAVNVEVPTAPAPEQANDADQTLLEVLAPYIGIAKDLPPNASQNIDEVIYGDPHNERGRRR